MASSHHNTSPMRAGPHTQSNSIDVNTPQAHYSQQPFTGLVIGRPVLESYEPDGSYRHAFQTADLSSQGNAAQQNIHSSFEASNTNNFPTNNEHAHTVDPSFISTGAVNTVPFGEGDSLGVSILNHPFNAAPLGESGNIDWQGLWDFDYNAIPDIPSDVEAPFPNLDNTQGFHSAGYANYGDNQAPQPSFEQQALPFTYFADDNAINHSLSRFEVAPEQQSPPPQQFPIYTTDNGTLILTSEQPQQPQTLETQMPPQMTMQDPPNQGANDQATGEPPHQEMQDAQSLAREVEEEVEEEETEEEEVEEEEESRREDTEETTEEGPVGWRPPTFEDLMSPEGRNIDIATRFTSYEEASRALNPPQEALDPDLDLTEVQKRAIVKALVTAINNIEGADDNEKTVQKWTVTSQSQSQPLKVEAASWRILEAAISYHRSGALTPTLEEWKRKKRGKKISDKDGISLFFGERISNLIEILRIKKTICKRMVEDSYMHIFVQAPFHCSARVESNRLINEQKGRYIHAGRVFERAEEQKRRQEEAARVASESTQASRATSGEALSTQNVPSLPMSSAAEIMPNVGGYPLMPTPETMGSFTMVSSDRNRATHSQGPQTASHLRAPYQTLASGPNIWHNAPPAATSFTNPPFAGPSSSSRATPISRAPSAGLPLAANQPVFQNYTRFIYEDPSVDQPHRINRTRQVTAPRPANPPHTSPPVAKPNPATSRVVSSAHNRKRSSPGDKGEGGSSRAAKRQRRR